MAEVDKAASLRPKFWLERLFLRANQSKHSLTSGLNGGGLL
jgi:hypothetical protein